MTHQEFIATVYAKLDEGKVEINGQIFYKEQKVLEVMEWFEEHWVTDAQIEASQKLLNIIKNLPTFGEVKSIK